METINARISGLISNLGISKTKFAEQLNLSPSFVTRICAGDKIPSDRTISDICRIFNVSELWLRTGDGEMHVRRSRNEEIAMLINDLMREEDESFRKRFTAAMLELPAEFWPELEKFFKKLGG